MPALFNSGRTFAAIVERARPGSAIPYHIGQLGYDADKDEIAKDVALMARRLSVGSMPIGVDGHDVEYGMGIGTLVQRKIGSGMYEYVFVKSVKSL